MADELDIISLEDATAAVYHDRERTEDEQDVDLALLVTAVSRRVDALCGPVVARSVTDIFDGSAGSSLGLRLSKTPVLSVTTVELWDGVDGSDLTALSAEGFGTYGDYLLDNSAQHYAYVTRRSSGYGIRWEAGTRNVRVVYQAGRFADTESVDERWRAGVMTIVQRMWKRDGGLWGKANPSNYFPSGDEPDGSIGFYKAIDPVISELLADEKLPPVIA